MNLPFDLRSWADNLPHRGSLKSELWVKIAFWAICPRLLYNLFLERTNTHTHKHTLSLSLLYTHTISPTHTHILSPSLSLTHTHSLTHLLTYKRKAGHSWNSNSFKKVKLSSQMFTLDWNLTWTTTKCSKTWSKVMMANSPSLRSNGSNSSTEMFHHDLLSVLSVDRIFFKPAPDIR